MLRVHGPLVHGPQEKQGAAMQAESVSNGFPEHLRTWLDDWGPSLRHRLSKALGQAWQETFQQRFQDVQLGCPVLVGTDCSGIEAPIFALKGLNYQFKHMWSSECEDMVRKVVLANCPPSGRIYSDVKNQAAPAWCLGKGSKSNYLRPQEVLQPLPPEFVHLYISGFSCKPFSTLHHNTKLLDEPQAEIFWAVVSRLRCIRPPCFLLENVKGITRCLPDILEALQSNGLYFVSTVRMDPSQLGEPLQRPRVYFFGVRHDVARGSQAELQQILQRTWGIMTHSAKPRGSGPTVSLSSRLLPSDHPVVQEYQRARRQRWLQARSCLVFGFCICRMLGVQGIL